MKILPVTIFRKLVPDGCFSRDPGHVKQRYLPVNGDGPGAAVSLGEGGGGCEAGG